MCVGGCGIEIRTTDWFGGDIAPSPVPHVPRDRFIFISSGIDIIRRVLLLQGRYTHFPLRHVSMDTLG